MDKISLNKNQDYNSFFNASFYNDGQYAFHLSQVIYTEKTTNERLSITVYFKGHYNIFIYGDKAMIFLEQWKEYIKTQPRY